MWSELGLCIMILAFMFKPLEKVRENLEILIGIPENHIAGMRMCTVYVVGWLLSYKVLNNVQDHFDKHLAVSRGQEGQIDLSHTIPSYSVKKDL